MFYPCSLILSSLVSHKNAHKYLYYLPQRSAIRPEGFCSWWRQSHDLFNQSRAPFDGFISGFLWFMPCLKNTDPEELLIKPNDSSEFLRKSVLMWNSLVYDFKFLWDEIFMWTFLRDIELKLKQTCLFKWKSPCSSETGATGITTTPINFLRDTSIPMNFWPAPNSGGRWKDNIPEGPYKAQELMNTMGQ